MTSAALFILAVQAAAITIVFVRGSIFERVRDNGPKLWQELAGCPLCAGVWIGFGWHALRYCSPSGSLEATFEKLRGEWLSVALDGMATGALTGTLAFSVAVVLNFLEDPGVEITTREDHHHNHESDENDTPGESESSNDETKTESDDAATPTPTSGS